MNVLKRTLNVIVAYKAHPPRRESPTYRKTHHHLIYELDAPCWVCGIRHSTGGKMETHHFFIEWAAQFGVDPERVAQLWPALTDTRAIAEWVDSESNMLVLCAAHHRGRFTGIHCVDYPVWLLQRWQGEDWTFVDQSQVPKARVPLLSRRMT